MRIVVSTLDDGRVVTAPDAVVSVDLGKTRCRVAVWRADEVVAEASGPGLPGLADAGSAARTAPVIADLVAQTAAEVAVKAIGIGAAGALTAPDAAQELAQHLDTRLAAPVAVASDIVTAHIGAFAGEAGVCLVAGTGAVALGVSADGRMSRRDGLGPLVGDLGSGAWIGRAGVRAAELAQAGAGAPTLLADLIARAREVASTASGSPDAAALLARHAPAVLEAAGQGDAVAADILDDAADALSATAHAAALDTGRQEVAVLGGLAGSDTFLTHLRAGLAARGLITRSPAGTAHDGARLMATRRDLLLEGFIHRAQY